jgi:4-alpha-glucanotransferase
MDEKPPFNLELILMNDPLWDGLEALHSEIETSLKAARNSADYDKFLRQGDAVDDILSLAALETVTGEANWEKWYTEISPLAVQSKASRSAEALS